MFDLLPKCSTYFWQPDLQCDLRHGFRDRFQMTTAAINAERHRAILVSGDPLDQRVLNPCIPQVINERVAEAVEGSACVGYAQLALCRASPQPLRRAERRATLLPARKLVVSEDSLTRPQATLPPSRCWAAFLFPAPFEKAG